MKNQQKKLRKKSHSPLQQKEENAKEYTYPKRQKTFLEKSLRQ